MEVEGAAARRAGAEPLESFAGVIAVNLLGTINCLRLAAATMVANDPDSGGETIRRDGALRMCPR